jgi:AraC family transcriptional regulator
MSAAAWAASAAMSVGFLHSSTSDGAALCRFDAIEIFVPSENGALSAVYRTDDGGERKAYVCAPMVAVIPPGVDCALQSRQPADTLVMRIASEFFDARVSAGSTCASTDRLTPRYAALDPLIRSLARELQDELEHARSPENTYLNAIAEVVAVHLARHYAGPAPTHVDTGLAEHKLRMVQTFLRENISKTLHVDELAAVVHMSPFHFARMFKQATGLTPHLYVVMQRVEIAKAMLRTSDDPLIDVAARAGFRTQGHFTGVFHRYTGVTPRVFRTRSRTLPEA